MIGCLGSGLQESQPNPNAIITASKSQTLQGLDSLVGGHRAVITSQTL